MDKKQVIKFMDKLTKLLTEREEYKNLLRHLTQAEDIKYSFKIDDVSYSIFYGSNKQCSKHLNTHLHQATLDFYKQRITDIEEQVEKLLCQEQ